MTPRVPATPAALLFTQQELGGPIVENESIVAIPAAASEVFLNGNGDRVGLVLINVGSFVIYVGVTPGNLNLGQGIPLPSGGGAMTLTVRDDFTLPSRAWYAYSPNNSSLYVLELIRFKQIEAVG